MAKADQGTLAADDMPNPAPEVAPPEPVVEQAPRVYAGTFKDPDSLEKGYGELKSKLDTQGGELGAIRAENKALQEQVTLAGQPTTPETAAPATDYEAAQVDLANKYENGDIDFPTYAQQSNAMTAQAVQERAQTQVSEILGQAEERTQATLAERDNQEMLGKFHEKYPDFVEKQSAGELEKVKADNPYFDDVNAYFAIKANEAKEAGRTEQASLESGSEDAGKVLADPGSAMQTPAKKPTTEAGIKASMLAAIQ